MNDELDKLLMARLEASAREMAATLNIEFGDKEERKLQRAERAQMICMERMFRYGYRRGYIDGRRESVENVQGWNHITNTKESETAALEAFKKERE